MPRILFCVLNWGLGHASRSVPIVKLLHDKGAEVFLASDGIAGMLLQKEFPNLPYFILPGMEIQYPRKSMWYNMLAQAPKIFKTMQSEHTKVASLVEKENIDLIISDNRYGCFHPAIRSVLITHQISPPTNYLLSDWILRKVINHTLQKFDEVWVPDDPDVMHLSGKLSRPFPKKGKYIGWLSRFSESRREKKYTFLAILSGPEPQRSYLEKNLLHQFSFLDERIALVRGREGRVNCTDDIDIYDLADGGLLQKLYDESEFVICRSGYSSIMDLIRINKPAILIPTPGQYEQEYLAVNVHNSLPFIWSSQESFDLADNVERLKSLRSDQPRKPYRNHLLEEAVNSLIP